MERPLQLRRPRRVGDSRKAQGYVLVDHPNRQKPKEAATNPEEQAHKTREPQGEWTLGNHPLR